MKAFFALAKISFLNLLLSTTGGRSKNRKGRQRSGWAALLFLAFIMLFISGNYSFLFAGILGPMGGLDVMLMLMLIIGLCMCTFLTLYLSQSLLFAAKDIDLVLSLPVSTLSVLLSRLMALYLEILFMMELFLLPCGIAWLANGGGGGVGFMILLLLSGIFLSFIPAFFSLLFGSFIGLVIARTRFKNLFNTLFSLVFVLAILFFSFGSNNYMSALETNIEPLRNSLLSGLPPLAWLIQALTEPQILLYLLVAITCILPFFLLSLLISRFYKRLLTSLLNQHVRNDYKLGRTKTRGSFWALMGKESRRFFGTPAYILNSGIGMVLMLAGAGALLFFRSTLQDTLALLTAVPGVPNIATYLPAALQALCLFFLTTFLPSTVSLSLEGKNLWILQEAPLPGSTILFAKAGFHFACGAVCSTVAILLAGLAVGIGWTNILLVLVFSLLFLALNALTGIAINVKHPRFDAENDTIIIKQSTSTLLGMLATLLEGLLMFGLYFLLVLLLGLSYTAFALLGALLLLVGCALLTLWLYTRGSKIFAQLS